MLTVWNFQTQVGNCLTCTIMMTTYTVIWQLRIFFVMRYQLNKITAELIKNEMPGMYLKRLLLVSEIFTFFPTPARLTGNLFFLWHLISIFFCDDILHLFLTTEDFFMHYQLNPKNSIDGIYVIKLLWGFLFLSGCFVDMIDQLFKQVIILSYFYGI